MIIWRFKTIGLLITNFLEPTLTDTKFYIIYLAFQNWIL